MRLELILLLLSTIGRILVGLVLLIAGIAKLRTGASQFLKDILAYELLPHWASSLLAYWLPPVEIITGLLLIVGFFASFAAVAAFVLLFVFAGAVGLALWRGKEINCGCFGKASRTRTQWKIVYRNLALMGMTLSILVGYEQWLMLLVAIWLSALMGVIFARLIIQLQAKRTSSKRSTL